MAGSRKQVDERTMAKRLVEIEGQLARKISPKSLETAYAERWGITHRQVRKLIHRVQLRWDAEARNGTPHEIREQRRNGMRVTLETIVAQALSRTEVVKDAKGAPVMGPGGQPLTRPSPDHRSAVRALRTLMDLDGLAQPKELTLHHQGVIEQRHVFEDASPDELRAYLLTGRTPEAQRAAPAPALRLAADTGGNGAGPNGRGH